MRLSCDFPRRTVAVSAVREKLDHWSRDEPGHMRLLEDADLSFPIILAADGEVMDGRHRVMKAALEGRQTIEAVQFEVDPEPDYVGVQPEDLPYD